MLSVQEIQPNLVPIFLTKKDTVTFSEYFFIKIVMNVVYVFSSVMDREINDSGFYVRHNISLILRKNEKMFMIFNHYIGNCCILMNALYHRSISVIYFDRKYI